MQIKIIGARALNPIGHKKIQKHAAVWLKSGKISLQIGAGNVIKRQPDLLLITHLHSDHIKKIHTAPQGTLVGVPDREFIKKLERHSNLEFQYFPLHKPVTFGDFNIIAFEVPHSKHTRTFGYLITTFLRGRTWLGQVRPQRIVWLPDFRKFTGVLKYFKDLDILFLDGSTFEKDVDVRYGKKWGGHMAVTKALTVLRQAKLKPRQIILIHLGKTMMPIKDRMTHLKNLFPEFNLDYAWDGREMNL